MIRFVRCVYFKLCCCWWIKIENQFKEDTGLERWTLNTELFGAKKMQVLSCRGIEW